MEEGLPDLIHEGAPAAACCTEGDGKAEQRAGAGLGGVPEPLLEGSGLSDEQLLEITPAGVLVPWVGLDAEQLSELDDGGVSLGGEDPLMCFL